MRMCSEWNPILQKDRKMGTQLCSGLWVVGCWRSASPTTHPHYLIHYLHSHTLLYFYLFSPLNSVMRFCGILRS
jgi:hypothetical protein